MNNETKEQLIEFLAKQEHLAIATVSTGGVPMAHTVGYVSDGTTLYFMSDKKTRKAVNIAGNSRVSCAMYDTKANMATLLALQLEGNASVVTDMEEFGKQMGAYMTKFPFLKDMPPNPDMQMYRITPESGRFMDNNKGFAHSEDVEF